MPASIFNGTAVKILKDILRFKTGKELLSLTSDPSAVATLAPQGSIGLYGVTLYLKQDAGSTTNWINFKPSFLNVLFDSSNEINGPVTHLSNLQKIYSHIMSAGVCDGCAITNNLDGTVSIASGSVALRESSVPHSNIKHVNIAASGVLALTDDNTNYLYVDYNAGAPQWVVSTSIGSYNGFDKVLGYFVTREVNSLHIVDARDYAIDNARKTNQLLIDSQKFTHKTGGTKIGSSGLNVTVTSGEFSYGTNKIPHVAFDTSVAGVTNEKIFEYYYQGWVSVPSSKSIDNTQYDNAGVLTALTAAKWKVDWVYMRNNDPSTLAIIYGQQQYNNAASAQLETAPASLPPSIEGVGYLIGRYLVQQGTATVIEQSAFDIAFNPTVVVNHNELSNIDGGTTDEYYHDTLAEHDRQILLEKERKVLEAENFRLNVPATIFGDSSATVTISSEIGTPLEGATSLKMVQASAAPSDYFTMGATYEYDVTLQMQIYGTLGFEYATSFNGDNGDQVFRIEFYNGADWTTLAVEEMDIVNGDKYNRRVFNLPATATKIRVGSKIVTASDTHILYLDDIALIGNPLPTAESLEKQTIWYDEYVGVGSTNTKIPYFATEIENSGNSIVEIENSSANGFSIYAPYACTVFMSSTIDMGNTDSHGISLNSTALSTGIAAAGNDAFRLAETNSNALPNQATIQVNMKAGETLRPHLNNAATDDDPRGMIYISVQASSANLVFGGVTETGATENDFAGEIVTSTTGTWSNRLDSSITSISRSSAIVTINLTAGMFDGTQTISLTNTSPQTIIEPYNVVITATTIVFRQLYYTSGDAAIDLNWNIIISRGDDYISKSDVIYTIPTQYAVIDYNSTEKRTGDKINTDDEYVTLVEYSGAGSTGANMGSALAAGLVPSEASFDGTNTWDLYSDGDAIITYNDSTGQVAFTSTTNRTVVRLKFKYTK